MAIDTLEYVKKLEAAGIDRKQAEAHAQAASGLIAGQAATKPDLDNAALRLEGRIDRGVARLDGRLNLLPGWSASTSQPPSPCSGDCCASGWLIVPWKQQTS
jgi:hypothetical protein